MDGSEEDADLLNEETFDCAEIGDWECEHELFVQNLQEESEKPPAADELPEFWKDSDSFSFLWSSDNLNCNLTTSDDTGERVVDVEETLKKLVLDETFEDPAILDISRKVSCQKLNDESFQHLRNAPAYPTVPTNIINGTRDIWSIDSCGESGRTNENVNLASGCSAKPKSIVDVIRSLTACASVVNGNKLVSIESHTKNNSVYRSNTESQTRQANSTSCPKSHPPVGIHNITSSVGQNEVDLISLLRIGNHAVQSQTNQNHPSVHNNIHQTHLPANSASMEILKGHLPTDANVLLRLSALTNMHSSLRDYSQIHNSLLIQNQHIIRQNLPPTFPVTSNQCSVFISPGVSGLLGSNIQPNILPYLPRFPTHPVNVNFKPHVCQASPIVTSPKMSAGSVGSTEEINPVKQIDPNRGSWMTDYESIGVLLIQLRPLIVSNPYVQDYYFASRWLRRMNEVRAKHIANGQRTTAPLATSMQIPIPIPLESLNDSQSPYQVSLKHKLVIPFSAVNICHNSDQNMEENCDNPEKSQENSETPTPECSNALGRPTRSNVHRPRVVAELSLVSALTAAPEQSPEKTLNNEDVDEQGIRCLVACERVFSNRRRRVLLARIERMFSILLILDEVSLSLEKVVVQNDARARLLDYQQKLIDQLTSELFKSPGRTAKEIYETLPEDNLFHLSDNIFTIRKGMRLWPLVLRYLPTKIKTNYLAEFINDFLHLHKLWPTTMNEAAAIFYPHLREIIYQMGYINDFLEICFPDALKMNSIADNSELTISISDNLISLLECKLGLSLIFCLMDACARASNPTDPSYFIQFGAYFIYANSLVVRNSQTDDCDHVMESFPHLASILMLYIRPSRYRLITDDHLNVFCELAKGIKVMSNNSNNNTNEYVNNSNPPARQCITSTLINSHPNQYQAQTMNSQNDENILSNIVKTSKELSV